MPIIDLDRDLPAATVRAPRRRPRVPFLLATVLIVSGLPGEPVVRAPVQMTAVCTPGPPDPRTLPFTPAAAAAVVDPGSGVMVQTVTCRAVPRN